MNLNHAQINKYKQHLSVLICGFCAQKQNIMKTRFLTLIVLLGIATSNINAQGFVWAEGFGTNGDDVLMAHKTDNAGNHYMAGYFSGGEISFGDIVLTNSNGGNFLPDLFLAKFDSEWNALWAYSPDNDEAAYGDIYNPIDLDVDGDGNCYLSGSFRIPQLTFGETTLVNISEEGEFDPFIAKFNTLGNISWATNFGGIYRDKGRCIVVDPSSAYVYVSGWFYSGTIEIGGISYYNDDNSTNTCDIFLAKYSATGDLIWATTAGGDNIDRCQDMEIDEEGNIFLAGTYKGSDIDFNGNTLENTNTYFDDGFIVKYSPDGEVMMTKKAGGMLDDIISTIAIGQNGNYYIGGTFLSSNMSINGTAISNHVQSGEATYDAFVAKYNYNDGLIWLKRAGGLGNDALNNIAVDELDNVYLTGGFDGEDFHLDNSTLTNNGPEETFDIYLAMLNPYGNLEWLESAGSVGNDVGLQIIVEGPEEILIDCISDMDITFGNISMTNSGGMDIYVAKFANNLNVFSGKVFYDANKNGLQDEGETNVPDMLCEVGGNYYSTDNNGEFEIYLEPGNYTFNPQSPEFFESVPVNMSFIFNSYGETNNNNAFALQALSDTVLMEFEVLSPQSIRKGQEFKTYYSIKNIGSDTLKETYIAVAKPIDFIYNTSEPIEDSISTDSIYYHVPELLPFESFQIEVNQQLDSVLMGADTLTYKSTDDFILIIICYQIRIRYLVGMYVGQYGYVKVWRYKYYTVCEIILIPLDPNNIEVTPSDTIPFTPAQLAAREPLEYTINFQNVGNDTCFNAVVLDTISDNLDLSTFEMIAASHDYSVAIDGRALKFTFNNILLPDSTTNEPESHGYIKYRILPYEDLEIGDSITNKAYIYFDYEPAVITNTVSTKIGEAMGVDENEEEAFPGMIEGKVNIFPNPFDNTATITIPDEVDEYAIFEVYDISGRKVKAIEVGKKKQFKLNRGTLKTGMYIYMLKNRKKNVIDRGKMIIN